jgi:hypothetical protein
MATPPHKVTVPGRPPAPIPADDQSEAVSDLTKAEQEAGKETLKTFGERLKAEQEAGEALVAQASGRTTRPKPPSEPEADTDPDADTEPEADDEPKPAARPSSKPNPLHGSGHSRR